ncbi:MAG: protein-glutamate O-methyltransferase CheR [Pseudomonadota bacterium]
MAIGSPSRRSVLPNDSVDMLARYIFDHWGLVIDERHRSMLQTRLQRRMRELRKPSLEAYCDYLFKQGGIKADHRLVCEAVTTQTTSFFREAHHFEFLTKQYLPELCEAGEFRGRPLRAWSAAASIGQEAYTLAITLAEYQRARRGPGFEILATDINGEALRQVASGIYPAQDVRGVPNELRTRYFLRGRRKLTDYVRVVPELRQRVTPRQMNLIETPYSIPSGYDVIMIRNCLIYFDGDTRLKVVQALRDRLRPGGVLMTGHSEHFPARDLDMEAVGPSVYRRGHGRRSR